MLEDNSHLRGLQNDTDAGVGMDLTIDAGYTEEEDSEDADCEDADIFDMEDDIILRESTHDASSAYASSPHDIALQVSRRPKENSSDPNDIQGGCPARLLY